MNAVLNSNLVEGQGGEEKAEYVDGTFKQGFVDHSPRFFSVNYDAQKSIINTRISVEVVLLHKS